MSIFGRVLGGAASNLAGKSVSLLVWFLITPFILSAVGPGGYGLWILVGSVASYGYLLDFGIGSAVVKYVAEHTARGEYDKANVLLGTALRVYLWLGLAAFGGASLLAPAFPRLFGIDAAQAVTAMIVVLLTGLAVGLTLAFAPVTTTLHGLQRYDLYNAINAGGSLVTAVATVAVLAAGWGVVGMIAVSIPVTLLMRLAARRMIRRVEPALDFDWRRHDPALLKGIFSFSAATFGLQVSGRLNTKTDEFVIAALRPVALVAPYALARKLGELAQLLTEQLLKTFMPLASELNARGARGDLRELYLSGTRLATGLFVPLALPLVLFGGDVLGAWVGEDYRAYGGLVALLAVAALFLVIQYPAAAVLQGVGRHHRIAAVSLSAGVVNVGLSAALLPLLSLTGVALASVIAGAGATLLGVMPYVSRTIGVSFREITFESCLPALLPAVPAAAVLLIVERVTSPTTLPGLILLGLTGAIPYLAAYLAFPVCTVERDLVRRLGAKVRGRFRRHEPGERDEPGAAHPASESSR